MLAAEAVLDPPAGEEAAFTAEAEPEPPPEEPQAARIGTVSKSAKAVEANARNDELDISGFDRQRIPSGKHWSDSRHQRVRRSVSVASNRSGAYARG